MGNALVKLSKAEKWLAEAKTLEDLKEIHDIAIAADAYAKAHKLGLQAENHAMEVRLLAARRMGELVSDKEHGGDRKSGTFQVQDSDLNIPKQRLSEFRKLAEIPIDDFKEKIEDLKEREERITYNKLLKSERAHVAQATGESEWNTPKEFINSARKTMGTIDIDPASNEEAQKYIEAKIYYTREMDGLNKSWPGNVWMNPPYSQPLIKRFCNLLVKKIEVDEIKQACVLVNNATETQFFQNMLKICKGACFIKGRVKFIDKKGNASSAPLQGQVILYFGKKADIFAREFYKFGEILWSGEK